MTGWPEPSSPRIRSATAIPYSRWPPGDIRARSTSPSSVRWRPTRWPRPSCVRPRSPPARADCRPRAIWEASRSGCAEPPGNSRTTLVHRRLPHVPVSLHLILLILYSAIVVGLGIWTARFVRSSSAFFVAGRSLGPGLIFASMLAANIGAGSTVGAAGLAYRDGLSAWWWVGAAGIGSLVFAFTVAPRLWSLAREHDFYTTGDYLELRYGPAVRGVATLLVAVGSLALLAGQLIAGAAILNVITGMPRWAGALTGGAIMTIYFTAGGLLGSAWINTLQLVVMLVGFSVALPFALGAAGGFAGLS